MGNKNSKKAVAMSFNWIFAIIVGGIILFLAIYGIGKFVSTGEEIAHTETAAKLIALLDPFETGLASGKSSQINFKKETRTFYDCEERDNRPFGRQTLAFSEKTIGDKYGEKGEEITIKNKYVFAEDIVEGKTLYIFSKPFFMGFKVSDLIMINAKDYCFYQAPNEIGGEIENLNLKNIQFEEDDLKNCTGEKVCFADLSGCDIIVLSSEGSYDYGRVIKNNKEMYFLGNLVFGAIFSSPEIYECNVKRLMSKFNELSKIYLDKINIIKTKGCSSNMGGQLSITSNFALELNSSRGLGTLSREIKNIEEINNRLVEGCKVY